MQRLSGVFLLFTIYYLLFTIFPSPAFAATCYETNIANDVGTIGCLENYIRGAINFLFPIAAAVALFFLLWGAIKFILSGGDPKNVEAAKKTLTYALFGLAIIFGVWLIFKVIEQLTGLDLTKYNIVIP